MTKFELKQIIKGLIMESINESTSKNFVSSKKTKKLKEQEEMTMDPQSSAEPDAGELEGPEDVGPTGNELLLANIDSIIASLNDLKAGLQGDVEGGEESGDENEMGEEELNGEPEDEQV